MTPRECSTLMAFRLVAGGFPRVELRGFEPLTFSLRRLRPAGNPSFADVRVGASGAGRAWRAQLGGEQGGERIDPCLQPRHLPSTWRLSSRR